MPARSQDHDNKHGGGVDGHPTWPGACVADTEERSFPGRGR